MHSEKHQFKLGKDERHRRAGRLGGGYLVGGFPWFMGYYTGFTIGANSGLNQTAQNNYGQESANAGDSGIESAGGAEASDGGGSGGL